MPSSQVQCPNCYKRYVIDSASLGKPGRCNRCGTAFTLAVSELAEPTSAVHTITSRNVSAGPSQVGRFRIRARLGAGAFGTVYRAHDPILDREVALKIPHPGTLQTPKAVARFLREAKAAAQLRHPHIVPVFDARRDGSLHYIASAFIAGQTLADLVDEGSIDFRKAARIVLDLAGALHYAHEAGIVHRDVKPANVMLDESGRAHLMDFGLARFALSEEKLTGDGAIVGTPAYMAPEQAAGQGEPIPASDQYSLGVVLYELLSGKTPFSGPPQIVIFNAIHQAPTRLRAENPQIPLDLETISLKAMLKTPDDRYANCQEMADDLRRWLESEPIRARPLGPMMRVTLWCKREPRLALTTALAIAGLIAVAVTATASAIVLADRAKREANARRAAEASGYFSQIGLVTRESETGHIAHARQLLDSCTPRLREWEWYYFKRQFGSELMTLQKEYQEESNIAGYNAVSSVAISPDGDLIASSGTNDGAVWSATSGRQIGSIWKDILRNRKRIMFDPGNARLLAVMESSGVKEFDVVSGLEVLSCKSSTSLSGFSISPNGHRFAWFGIGSKVTVWDGEAQRAVLELEAPEFVKCIAFSPDGKRLAAGCSDGSVTIWDAIKGQVLTTLRGHFDARDKLATADDSGVICLDFSSNDKVLASADSRGLVIIWDIATGRDSLRLPGEYVAFSPEGGRLATAGRDGAVRVWNVASGQLAYVIKGHTRRVTCVAFTPDGKRLLTAGEDSSVKMWNAFSSECIQADQYPVEGIAFSADSRRLATTSQHENNLKVWSVDRGDPLATYGRQVEANVYDGAADRVGFFHPTRVVFSSDGRLCGAADYSGAVKIWDVSAGDPFYAYNLDTKRSAGGYAVEIAFTRDATRLMLAVEDGMLITLDVKNRKELLRQKFSGALLALSPDAKFLAVKGPRPRPSAVVWDATHKWQTAVYAADNTTVVKETQSLNDVATLAYFGSTNSAGFSPDGKYIAIDNSVNRTHRTTIFQVATGLPRSTLVGHTELVSGFSFNPYDTRVATASYDGSVKVWDVETGIELVTLNGQFLGRFGRANSVAFSPDGNLLAAGGEGGTVRVWDGRPLSQLKR